MPEYTWITEPPIVRVPKSQVPAVVQQIKNNLTGWKVGGDSTEEEEWDERVDDTLSILDLVKEGSDDNFVYKLGGSVVGFMAILDASPTYICDIVMHPGSAGGGATLIEFAANYSESKGHGGRLELYSYNDRSTQFYKAVGLTGNDSGGGRMNLNPSGNDLWKQPGGVWKLVKYAVQDKYLTIATPKVPPKPLPKPPSHRIRKTYSKPLPPIPQKKT